MLFWNLKQTQGMEKWHSPHLMSHPDQYYKLISCVWQCQEKGKFQYLGTVLPNITVQIWCERTVHHASKGNRNLDDIEPHMFCLVFLSVMFGVVRVGLSSAKYFLKQNHFSFDLFPISHRFSQMGKLWASWRPQLWTRWTKPVNTHL